MSKVGFVPKIELHATLSLLHVQGNPHAIVVDE